MSDRLDLEEYKERIAECEDDWLGVCPSEFIGRCDDLVAEIDRLRANEGSLCEKIRALTDENKKLRANQVPGRCGECAHLIHAETNPGYCEKNQSWWDKDESCSRHEWKPKE